MYGLDRFEIFRSICNYSWMKAASSFPDSDSASRVLASWRGEGPEKARLLLHRESSLCLPGPLLEELRSRLYGESGPRLLVDTLWLSRPYGGITRVWNQILHTWRLPGFLSKSAPIALIDRGSVVSATRKFSSFHGINLDPLNSRQVSECSEENSRIANKWGADVFCSTWISTTSTSMPSCTEVALVHDFLPERFRPRDPALLPLRRRWWGEATAHLAVSADTAADVCARLPSSASLVE